MLVEQNGKNEQFQLPMLEPETIITINVGGQKYQIIYSTFQRLTAGATNIKMIPVDTEGTEFFIDRDPAFFRYILNFAREGVPRLAKTSEAEMAEEAKAFGFGCCFPEMKKCKIHDPEGYKKSKKLF